MIPGRSSRKGAPREVAFYNSLGWDKFPGRSYREIRRIYRDGFALRFFLDFTCACTLAWIGDSFDDLYA